MTATLPPLGPTAEAWDHVPVVDAIARGGDWDEVVERYWKTVVSAAAHQQSHPQPIFGCPGCPQVSGCPSCGLPIAVCEDPTGHDRVRREGETSLLIGVASYGGSRC